MGIVFRQSVKNSVVTLAGAVLGALTVAICTKFLSTRQYGFIGNFTNYAVTVAQMLLLGINYTLVVYIHKYANDDRRRRLLLSWCIIVPGVMWVLATVAYAFLRTWVLDHFQPEDQPYMDRFFLWMPLYILLFIYNIIFEQYLSSQMRVAVAAFMREVLLRLMNIVLIVLFIAGFISFDVLVIGTVLVYFIPLCVLIALAYRTEGFGLSRIFSDFSWTEYKDLLGFTWYHFLLTISALLMASMDALLLPLYDHQGFSAGAIFRVAVFLVSLLQVPYKAMLPASFTVLARAFADDDRPKAADLFRRSSINIFIATAGVSLVLCCDLGAIVQALGDKYAAAAPVFLILFAGNIVNIATGMNDQVLSITNYYKFNFYLSILLLVVLFVLIRTLVPQYSVYGAAFATALTMVIFNTAKCIFVWRKLGMLPFSASTLKVIVAALPPLAIGYFLPHLFTSVSNLYVGLFVDVCLRSGLIVIAYILMLLWLRPSADLEEYIAAIKKNKRLF